MSPYEIGIMLHYYCTRSVDHKDMSNNPPVWRPTIDSFLEDRLLLALGSGGKCAYEITERGHAFVEHLCAVRIPIGMDNRLIESLHALEQKWRETSKHPRLEDFEQCADELLAVLRACVEREQPSNGETEAQRALRLSRKYVFVTYANLAHLDHNNQEEAQLLRIIDKGIAELSNPDPNSTGVSRSSKGG